MMFEESNIMKTKRLQSAILVALTTLGAASRAEIVLDGTLGLKGALIGPNYLIKDTMGQQVGGNLFHSFESFTVNTGETAAFTGPDSVSNIISRVTGNQASFINGPLRSQIHNANMYFLNPNGILFGEQARLDIQGSFHVSTADTLYLGKEGRFDASTPSNSFLTMAPPSRFGFLSNTPAEITVQDSLLQVPEKKTLSIIGGNLQIENAALYAPDGQVNLVSVASTGEVIPGISNTSKKWGTITLSQSPEIGFKKIGNMDIANVDTTGVNGGHIFIQGGKFFSSRGYIASQVAPGTQKNVGSITIEAPEITLQDKSAIDTNTYGNGDSGNITITATERLSMRDGSGISVASAPETSGHAGNIHLKVGQLTLQEDSFLNSGTLGSGTGGDITITANQGISLSGSRISSTVGNRSTSNSGNGGDIHITAPRL